MLGSPILYLKGMRIMMFQLSGFYCRAVFRDMCSGLRFRVPFLKDERNPKRV